MARDFTCPVTDGVNFDHFFEIVSVKFLLGEVAFPLPFVINMLWGDTLR